MTDIAQEVKTALAGVEKQVGEKLDTVNEQVKAYGEASAKDRAELKAAVNELESVSKQHEELKSEMTDLLQKQNSEATAQEAKSVGEQFIASDEFKNYMSGTTQKARFEVKNTIVNSGNTVSRHEQLQGVVPGAFRQLTVMPTVMQGAVNSNIVYYSRELAWTNAAAGTAEGSTKPESTLTFEEVNTPVRTIAHWLKVSKQALDDSTFLASYIDRRLRHGVNNKVEDQIINGDGTGQNLDGWIANATATDPLLTTDIFGLANKMKYEIIGADYVPDYFYMNPTDFAALETTRRGTGDAAFVAQSGAVSYVNNGLTPLLWGLPVVVSNNVPAGTIICKSMDADMYGSRQGTVVEMFEQDGTNVQDNLVTVRAETRGAELIFTPAAIRTGAIASIT